MKAALIAELGTAPRPVDVADPVAPEEGFALVKVEAVALNAIDLHIAAGTHRAGKPRLPYVPGLESVGTIVSGPDAGRKVRAVTPAGLVPGRNGGSPNSSWLIERRAASCQTAPTA